MSNQSSNSFIAYNVFLALSLMGLVFSGIFKALFELSGVNIYDLTILSAISIILLISIKFKSQFNRDGLFLSILLGMFSISYLSSFLYSPSSIYGPQKLIGFMGLLFSFGIGLVMPKGARDMFISLIPNFGIFIAIAFILIMTSNIQALLEFDISGTSLIVGEILGVGAIISIFKLNKSIFTRLGMLLSISLILFLGARGPLIFLLLIGLILALFYTLKNVNSLAVIRKQTISFIIIAISSIFIIISMLSGTTIFEFLESGFSRFLLFFESDKGGSINSRIQMIFDAINFIDQAPILGHGLGSYGLIVYGVDFRAYPHNGVLEIWFEAGILGLILFIAFILSGLFVALKREYTVIACIIVFLIFNFLKSSSLDELRLLFLICGFSAGYLVKEKEYQD